MKLPPAAIAAFWMQVWPKEWKSGSAASATSSPASGISRGTTTAQLMQQVRVRELGALGLARGARGVEDHGGVGGERRVQRRQRRRAAASSARLPAPALPAHSTGTPAASAPARAAASNSGMGDQQARLGVLEEVGTSGAAQSTFSGTTVQPA